MYVLYCLVPIITLVGITIGNDEKRLILNDPDDLAKDLGLITQRVSALETLVQSQQTTIYRLQTENQNLQTTTLQQKQALNYGATYIRWGRKICPGNGTELVYSGYAAGDAYRSGGGGNANLLCLPRDPALGKQTPDVGSAYEYLRGAEYETNFFGPKSSNEDIPCAVCRSFDSSSILMIPGRTSCYNGWKQEYGGNLAGGNSANPTEYICIDGSPEMIVGGSADNNSGRRYYPVRTSCGPLPCPPYEQGKYVACVVCSK